MIKAIILMLVFVSMVQSEDTAPTGVTYKTFPLADCGGTAVVPSTDALAVIQTATNKASCKNGVVTYLTKEYTSDECLTLGVGTTSAKMKWTGGCVKSTSSGSAEAAATAFMAMGALAFL